MTWILCITAILAALVALGLWAAWPVLRWPYGTWEGDEE